MDLVETSYRHKLFMKAGGLNPLMHYNLLLCCPSVYSDIHNAFLPRYD